MMERHRIIRGVVVIFSCLLMSTAASSATAVIGQIVSFECGDNCYLTIRATDGEIIDGLCSAKECSAWNEKAEIPPEYIGVTVRAQVGTGVQIDASGKKRGVMRSFEQLIFLSIVGESRKDDYSKVELADGWNRRLRQADQELNDEYRLLLQSRYQSERNRVINAQRKWIEFRDADCDLAGGWRYRYSCIIERTQERTSHLRAWRKGS